MRSKLKIVGSRELASVRPVPLVQIFGHDPLTRTADFPGSTQIRTATDNDLVQRYAALMMDGVVFPPIVLVEQAPDSYLLGDGHHRYEAACIVRMADPKSYPDWISAEVHPGTFADAIRLAIEGNRAHGKNLSDADWTRTFNRAVESGLILAHDTLGTVALLGCSERHAQRLTEFARRKYHRDRDTLILALADAGQTQEIIAERVGISRVRVSEILAECRKPPMAETDNDPDEDPEPEIDPAIDPAAVERVKLEAAIKWRAQIAATREKAAMALKVDPVDPIIGVWPLPAPPPVPFKRPPADDAALVTVSEALDLFDHLPDVAGVMNRRIGFDDDAEIAAAINERLDRSVEWLMTFRAHWTAGG